VSAPATERPTRASRRGRFETPGTLAIMLIYLGGFFVAWLLAFVYLATRWAIS
jgi:uncharacterized protein YybS (DUF2232 family)